jgi:FkbM family methyltransferase
MATAWMTIKRMIRNAVYRVVPPPYVPPSYSQAGEDAVLRFLFADRRMRSISYLDIGTNAPDFGNNTYLFYRSGSRGVCVEADRTLIPAIEQVRPEDKILNVGVSADGRDTAVLYVFDVNGMNTFDKDEADRRAASGKYKVTDRITVKLVEINSLIRENFATWPDLLSIDIEGLDLAVLKSLDFDKYPIPVVCVETCRYSENHIRPKEPAITTLMTSKGYEVYADTYINTIFVRTAWFHG